MLSSDSENSLVLSAGFPSWYPKGSGHPWEMQLWASGIASLRAVTAPCQPGPWPGIKWALQEVCILFCHFTQRCEFPWSVVGQAGMAVRIRKWGYPHLWGALSLLWKEKLLSSTKIPGYSELEGNPRDHGVQLLEINSDYGITNTMFFWQLTNIHPKLTWMSGEHEEELGAHFSPTGIIPGQIPVSCLPGIT